MTSDRQQLRQRLRYLRLVDPLTIQRATFQELHELSARRRQRILDAGDWQYSMLANFIKRPEARA
jgi:hypothetical protein